MFFLVRLLHMFFVFVYMCLYLSIPFLYFFLLFVAVIMYGLLTRPYLSTQDLVVILNCSCGTSLHCSRSVYSQVEIVLRFTGMGSTWHQVV